MSGRWPGWSHLPTELLQVIAQDHLTSALDIVRLRCVCASWRAAVTADLIPPQLPWLLLPYRQKTPSLSFFSPSDRKLHTLTLPNSDWKSVFASSSSSHGYLLLLQENVKLYDGLSVSLFNPLNKHLIPFPPLPPELKSPFIRKAAIALSPAPLVAVWVYKKLAFCILGKPDGWRVVDVVFSYSETQCDLAYHDGYFYLASGLYLQVFNIKLSKKMSRSHRLHFEYRAGFSLHFAVSASGILFLLVGSSSERRSNVYRVDRSSKGRWSLAKWDVGGGDDLFFVSGRSSACVPAEGVSGWEERRGCYASEKFVEGGVVASGIHLAMRGKDGFCLEWLPDQYYWRTPSEHWADWKDVTGITWFLPKIC